MNGKDKMQETEGLAAEWEDLATLAEECPQEAEVIMEMLIEADDEDEDLIEGDVAA